MKDLRRRLQLSVLPAIALSAFLDWKSSFALKLQELIDRQVHPFLFPETFQAA